MRETVSGGSRFSTSSGMDALVYLGQPAIAAKGNARSFFLCTVAKDGGVRGGSGTDCTWTYTINTLDGNTELATLLFPLWPRYPLTSYYFGAENNDTTDLGLAYWDHVNGAYKLIIVYGEFAQTTTCSATTPETADQSYALLVG